jgi:FKBP-type peptidyl-prolyl cis-trans isomerase FkpA
MKGTKLALGTLAGLMLLVSCNSVDFKKTKGGMPYKLFPGSGKEKSAVGNVLKLNFKRQLNDSVMYTSYNTMPVYVPVSGESQPYDITELLLGLAKGDSIYATQLVDSFMKKNPQGIPPTWKKGDKMITSIKILEVFKTQQDAQKDEEQERANFAKAEDATLSSYMTKNNIKAQKTPGGVYVEVLENGTGVPVVAGKTVSVMYKGTTFRGTTFDTNMDSSKGHTEPLTFAVGQRQMIPGFDEGVQLLKVGDHARMYLPSMLAYGPQPPPGINPFENLIFEVKVLNVTETPQQPDAAKC